MAGFAALKDVSNAFEEEIRRDSSQLFTTKVGENFEDGVVKKMRDMSLFTSKLRLLKAKPLASTPQITEEDKANVMKHYEETATWTNIEQQTVKSVTQAHALRILMTTADSDLNPEMIDRKEKIKDQLDKWRSLETQLRQHSTILQEKHDEYMMKLAQYDKELGALKDIKASADDDTEEIDSNGPLYQKLRTMVNKMELMRVTISKLVTARTGSYDWLTDPHRRYAALKLSRQANTVEGFLRDHN
ncbi:unnamed protein product [Parnassius apollo]|uniref:(apollo) hypothetical protein n=1 Tax=Parnassius apollo TaxID=110799 RepID=A0A8S3X5P0_PARAO|nr:unnamed protein product [Parnassius apollo]